MKAFLNTEVTKSRLIASLEAHRAADRIVKGHYWQGNGKGKGCAVGCSIHDFREGAESEHALYEELFGIPTQIAYLEDSIFEALPEADAPDWPLRFARAIPEGADLSMVWPRFAVWMLTDPKWGLLRDDTPNDVRQAVQGVADGYSRRIAGDEPAVEEWDAIGEAARAAWDAWATRATWDAWAARAARAAWAARDAWDAWAAWATRDARVKASADELIRLLETAPQ